MRVLVTGGSGFIGTNLIEAIRDDNEVVSFDPKPPMSQSHLPHWVQGDVGDFSGFSKVARELRPTHVVHLAARTDLHGGKVEDYAVNWVGVENVARSNSLLDTPPRTIYASSRLVFAIGHEPANDFDYKPSTPYGESKIRGELVVRGLGRDRAPWTIVRPTSIWGPWFGTPYRDFFDTVATGRYVHAVGHDVWKSFGYVGNAVHILKTLMVAETGAVDGKVFWLTDYPATRLAEWANLVADDLGVRRPKAVPMPALKAAAKAGDILKTLKILREPPLTSFRLNNLITPMVYDTKSLEALVGQLPFTTNEGVRLTTDWIKGQLSTGKG